MFAFVAKAAAAEINSSDSISYAPVTWTLLSILILVVGAIYADLRGNINKLWKHGHGLRVNCTGSDCRIEVKTVGVMTDQG